MFSFRLVVVCVVVAIPMYASNLVTVQAFIEPDLRRAHVRIVNKFNPFSALLRPSYMLKSRKQVEEAKVLELMPGCTVTKESSYGAPFLLLNPLKIGIIPRNLPFLTSG